MTANSSQNPQPRPPVVVVMGHVDHGKTTLLDYIRKTEVAAKEAGGITQAVGAYEIVHQIKDPQHPTSNISRKITFIDTPGHEAFTKMRSRGAAVADLAILVVAAEEGLKPQTKESIKILNDAKIPFVVAINKVDKPEANIEKVKNELTAEGVLLEGYGGSVSFEPISAKRGDNVDKLLDLLLLTADVENLTYSPGGQAEGFILEAKLDPRRGMEVTAIVKNGTLREGDEIATASAKGKVKILENFLGARAKELSPSSPARIIGFETLPQVGEEFFAGKKINTDLVKKIENQTNRGITQTQAQDEKAIKFIIKASDSGSLEAMSAIIKALPSEKSILVLDEGVGDIGDNDVKNAIASGAIILGFKTRVAKSAKTLADIQNVIVITADIIYELVQAAEKAIKEPEKAAVKARLEILAVFNQKKLAKQLVGGKVLEGTMKNKANFEIQRLNPEKNEISLVGHGKILSLRSGKSEVNEVAEGNDCGFVANSGVTIQKGDHIIIK